ncbi:hypothetical protein R3P38DRAFT_2597356 [Favolaschia claudopus]|uniref:CCHC-type domain-containing protein n=1 Tax=Favolaschia claudopus TaxID=2862362 RepID=A0AAW0EFV7_9AGAR
MSYPNNSPLIAAYMTQHSSPLLRPLPDVPTVAPAATIASASPADGLGYVLPAIPPDVEILVMGRDSQNHRHMPTVSERPAAVDSPQVLALMVYSAEPGCACFPCGENGVGCNRPEAGIGCFPCVSLANPSCDRADPEVFLANLRHARDGYLHIHRSRLANDVDTGILTAANFANQYQDVLDYWYSGAQAAITRYLINAHNFNALTFRGYRQIFAASTSVEALSQFIHFAYIARIHPSVLELAAERLKEIFAAALLLISFHTKPKFNMSSITFDSPVLSTADEKIVRDLQKTLRATHYDDPVDQATFLGAAAESLLSFRSQVASFALSAELAECVFTLRTQFQKNNSHFTAPPSKAYADILGFVGEIISKRQLFRDRKRAQTERKSGAEAAIARAQRRDALEYAAGKASKKTSTPAPKDEDCVSIPSDDEKLDNKQLAVIKIPETPKIAPIANSSVVSSPIQALSSPLSPDVRSLMFNLRLNHPMLVPPVSPCPSLPGLEQIESPSYRPILGNELARMRRVTLPRVPHDAVFIPRPPQVPAPTPLVYHRLPMGKPIIQRPPTPRYPKSSLNDVFLVSGPSSIGFRARTNISPGKFKLSKKRSLSSRRQPKRCFHCDQKSHLIASCPELDVD